MKWMEIIRVCSSSDGTKEILDAIRERLSFCEQIGKGLSNVAVMVHQDYPGELSVHMLWDNDNPPAKSREGLLLADYLIKRGPISHHIWKIASEWNPERGK